ncbi:AlbA family DNA-binding domain-containing protein [Paraburkholderia dipogonis]|uniref:AlbA family DNA-binding domain-containing protein n=1 Tax=Paraburkholderia dipogonis TaxID=1211383 RepID=UPI0038B6E580
MFTLSSATARSHYTRVQVIPHARLEVVTEEDIENLVDHGVRESRTLDYKRDWPADRDSRLAVAQDVCAFANTVGGDLVFGVDDEKTGIAAKIAPIHVENIDKELLALTSFLRDSLEPRVTGGLITHAVPIAAGGHVIILRVAASPSAPHRATKDNHFYARTSVGKEPMDIQGIRHAFAAGRTLAQDIRTFCDEALTRIENRLSPMQDMDGPVFVCHVIPVSAFSRQEIHDIDSLIEAGRKLRQSRHGPNYPPMKGPHVNLDGVACVPARPQNSDGYVQLYRNGVVELAFGDMLIHSPLDDEEEGVSLFPEQYEIPLVRHGLQAVFQALASLDIAPPAYVMLNWIYTDGTRIAVETSPHHVEFLEVPHHLRKIKAAPIYIEDYAADALTVLRPAFDVLWNAVGVAHTKTDFDAN